MFKVFVQKVDFNPEEITFGTPNTISIRFIANDLEGTATVFYDENLKIKNMFAIRVNGDENGEIHIGLLGYTLCKALQSQFDRFVN